ncbi:hypothetical protein O3P69_011217 [Scylla paramamosain]|uniref:Uncharacterized protein n=1 Tax=Scylla paramamosain TaxID=85552 RepID=A0AAW0ST08_SCYPA
MNPKQCPRKEGPDSGDQQPTRTTTTATKDARPNTPIQEAPELRQSVATQRTYIKGVVSSRWFPPTLQGVLPEDQGMCRKDGVNTPPRVD